MKDISGWIEQTFKDEVAKACTARGIDHKSETGYWTGGHGLIGPVVDKESNIAGMAPTWMFGISLRSLLIGMPPIGASLPIHDVMPAEDAIRATAQRLVKEVDEMRKVQFKG